MNGIEAHQTGASGVDLQSPSQASPASVLLVDDQPARLLTYEAILAGLGVHCVRALSGTAALTALLDEQFAAILLDVQMPEMDGFEVARLIRAHPRYEQTPIIFVTGVHVSELEGAGVRMSCRITEGMQSISATTWDSVRGAGS